MPDLGGLQPWLQPYAQRLVDIITYYDPTARVTSTYRSTTEQARLYANRDSNPYPVAPPGSSYHEYGRAIDIVADPQVLAYVGQLWEQIGGTWGGRFGSPDIIHFQA